MKDFHYYLFRVHLELNYKLIALTITEILSFYWSCSLFSREANELLGSSLASAEVVPEADKKKNKKKKKNEENTSDAGSKSNVQTKAATMDMEQDQPVQKEHDKK